MSEKIEILESRNYNDKILVLGRKYVGKCEVVMIGFKYRSKDKNNRWLKFFTGALTNRETRGHGYDAFYHRYKDNPYDIAKRFYDNPEDRELINRFGKLRLGKQVETEVFQNVARKRAWGASKIYRNEKRKHVRTET